MARVKRAVQNKKKHKAVLEQAKGYYGDKSRTFRAANAQVMHSGNSVSYTHLPLPTLYSV